MIIVDTSVWIRVFKDKTGRIVNAFRKKTRADIILFSHFAQIELLRGAKDEFKFRRFDKYPASQYYLEATEQTWRQAAT